MFVQSLISATLVATGLLAEGALAGGYHVPIPAKAQRRYEDHYGAMLGKRTSSASTNSTKDFRYLTKETKREYCS
jgi:carboxypeptidase D